MKAGQITAKLRDAVPVCFFADGDEVTRYKNIDIPDSLKEIDIMDFGFNVAADGKITFQLHFENGILPTEFPPAREKMTRAEKAAAKAAKAEEATEEAITEPEADAEPATENAEEPAETPETPAIPETRFNVTGPQRKALVTAIGEFTGIAPIYKAAPTYAYMIGEYTVDRNGTLTGEASPELLAALAEQGFAPDENETA